MKLSGDQKVKIPANLLQEVRSFPVERKVEHCGRTFFISPFEFYAECPQCHTRIKVRAFSGVPEIEDVFDAVFAWMTQPGAEQLVRRRQQLMNEE
jgi:hypothetical protein